MMLERGEKTHHSFWPPCWMDGQGKRIFLLVERRYLKQKKANKRRLFDVVIVKKGRSFLKSIFYLSPLGWDKKEEKGENFRQLDNNERVTLKSFVCVSRALRALAVNGLLFVDVNERLFVSPCKCQLAKNVNRPTPERWTNRRYI